MLVCPSGVDVSSSALRFLASRLSERRRALGTRLRRLSTGRQALLTFAYLRNGQPYAQQYVTEAVELLARPHTR